MQLITDTQIDAPIGLVGGKAIGCLRLKSLEERLKTRIGFEGSPKIVVPTFFVVPGDYDLKLGESEILLRSDSLGDSFAVRSSSVLEDNGKHSFDGIFDTKLDVKRNNLIEAIQRIRESAVSRKARKYAKSIGVSLTENMPVMVQRNINDIMFKGQIYSKFPAARDITKVIIEENNGSNNITAFPRMISDNGKIYAGITPFVSSKYEVCHKHDIDFLKNLGIAIEEELGYHVIMEFKAGFNTNWDLEMNLLQARHLTGITKEERQALPELQDKNLIGITADINGVGSFTGEAYVGVYARESDNYFRIVGLEEFDASHPKGYALVVPYLQFGHDYREIDDMTPHKKAIVAYQRTGEHHDMEISRKRGIVYLNATDVLNLQFDNAMSDHTPPPIVTGERVRVVSDGELGYLYNLSRNQS